MRTGLTAGGGLVLGMIFGSGIASSASGLRATKGSGSKWSTPMRSSAQTARISFRKSSFKSGHSVDAFRGEPPCSRGCTASP